MRWLSRSRHHAITLAWAIGLVACTPRTRRTPDDTLVMISQEAMASSDPRYAISSYDSKLAKLVHAGLTAVDTPSLEPRLDLAARIDRIDDLTYDVALRPDAKFSDGKPVTARDVARTYHAVLDEGSDSLFHRGYAERFVAVEAITPTLVRFRLVKPFATFRSDIDFGILSFHGVPDGQPLASGMGRGAGPYILRELSSTAAYLDANPHYPERPKLPHVEIRFVKNDAARMLMLVGGSADLIQNSARQDLIDDVAERPRIRVTTSPSVLLTYLMMNNDDPMLRDVRVRRAIALALDRPKIIAAKFSGRAVLATGLLPPTHWAYEGDVMRYGRDLARARALLDEAGLRRGGDGTRVKLKALVLPYGEVWQ
nr:ABC transporter substrate-binding protein [Deltaproteobacteria bacterium]